MQQLLLVWHLVMLFLGINHSLAHKTGGEFGLPHGLAISIAMQHVIRYNAVSGNVKTLSLPTL